MEGGEIVSSSRVVGEAVIDERGGGGGGLRLDGE